MEVPCSIEVCKHTSNVACYNNGKETGREEPQINSVNEAKDYIVGYYEDSGFEPDAGKLDDAAQALAERMDTLGLDIKELASILKEREDGDDVKQAAIDALVEVCIEYGL